MSKDMAVLAKKLLESQKEIKHAIKDSKNPHLKNRYASLNAVLDEVKPILNKNGIVLAQSVMPCSTLGMSASTIVVSTKFIDSDTGEILCDTLPVPIKHKFSKEGVDLGPDAQELGSAITYGRRYGLLAMCAIASEDDDGEMATRGDAVVMDGKEPPAPSSAGASKSGPTAEELKAKIGKALGGFAPLKKND